MDDTQKSPEKRASEAVPPASEVNPTKDVSGLGKGQKKVSFGYERIASFLHQSHSMKEKITKLIQRNGHKYIGIYYSKCHATFSSKSVLTME